MKSATILVCLMVLALLGCSDSTAPQIETVSSLHLSAPTLIAAGETVSLKIEAVGSEGTRPFTDFNDEVSLAASVGEVTPNLIVLASGQATVDISLGAADGEVTLSASGSGVTGRISIDISALTALAADPSGNASASIPDLHYSPSDVDFDDQHPDLAGQNVSKNIILVTFAPSVTVGEANAVITAFGGVIVGGISGVANGSGGVLMLRVPTSTHAEMDAMIVTLEAESAVEFASPDFAVDGGFVPNSGKELTEWSWERLPAGGNWGMEMTRMPQMWNLNSNIAKRGDPSILTGIVDAGFEEHTELAFQRVVGSGVHRHGNHVAGTIAAGFNNGRGVDGVSPFARLRVVSPFLFSTHGQVTQGVIALARDGCRIINLSVGIIWSSHPDASASAKSRLASSSLQEMEAYQPLRDAGIMPLLVCSAGNDSKRLAPVVDASYASTRNYAALELGVVDIIVVEAIEQVGGGRRADYSNPGGNVSAPGSAILSTVLNNGYGLLSGTSMATPHVAGLASFLLSIDPSLTNDELFLLITSNTQSTFPNNGVEASPRIDGFAAALAIDGLRGSDTVVRMLLDIDDGTVDGNLRVRPDDPTVDFVDEDADGDGGIGDGRIDMCDFRRWRDWVHLVEGSFGAVFDGSGNHSKRDVNGDKQVLAPALEDIDPRGDFNGDGTLAPGVAVVPGESNVPRTDFEMIARHFDDSQFTEEILAELIHSGDVHVDLSQHTVSGRFTEVRSEVTTTSGEVIEFHEHTFSQPAYVYTLVSDQSYTVTTWGISNNDTLCTKSQLFDVGLCTDAYWLPECSVVDIEITLAEFIEMGSASPLLIRAGLIDANGNVVYQSGIDLAISTTGGGVASANGVTDVDGFFDTEVTMGSSSQQLNVFVTATDPVTGESAVVHATALPLGDASVVLTSATFIASASASVRVGGRDPVNDEGHTRVDFPPATGLDASHSAGAGDADPEQGWSADAFASAQISAEAIMGSSGRMTGATFFGSSSQGGSISGSAGCCSAFAVASTIMLLSFDVDTPVLATLSSEGQGSKVAFLRSDTAVLITENGEATLNPGSYNVKISSHPGGAEDPGQLDATLTFSPANGAR